MPLRSLTAQQLLQLIDSTSMMTWMLDANGQTIDRPQWSALTGQTVEELKNNGWLNAVHPDDRERASAAWMTAFTHGQSLNTDFRVRGADGVYRWFNSRGTPLLSPDGSVHCWVGMLLEIPGMWRFRSREDLSLSESGKADELELDPEIVRAARGMLDWSAADLAEKSGVSISTIRRVERAEKDANIRKNSTKKLKTAFFAAGLEFVVTDDAVTGVRWR